MILYLSSRTTETEILSLADKVKKMLKCARKKSIEKKERDSLSFLSKLSTETLKRIAFGNMTKEELELRMRTTTEIKRTLARVANMALNGEIDTKVANTVILACNAILGAIKTDEQQKKIDELEELLNEINGK